ncbi:hypothetical protein ABS71_14610 [bacterium SCN 62-11]|nr:MAG: hypothetical protein ABS71_14610 [bacterium SCN 62-11]
MKIQSSPPNFARLQRELREAQSELALFDLQDQVLAQSGCRSSQTYGFKAPALGLLSGTLGGAALALVPALAPWSLLAGPGVGLGLGLAWESIEQRKFAREHQTQREQKLETIEELKRDLGW